MKITIAFILSIFLHFIFIYPYNSKKKTVESKKFSVNIKEVFKKEKKYRNKNKIFEKENQKFKRKSSEYLNIVRSYIINNKQNYFLIKKMNLSGSVRVRFDILYPNKIENFSFLSKSEKDILNKSARDSILSIENLPYMSKELEGQSLTLEVVISYQ